MSKQESMVSLIYGVFTELKRKFKKMNHIHSTHVHQLLLMGGGGGGGGGDVGNGGKL